MFKLSSEMVVELLASLNESSNLEDFLKIANYLDERGMHEAADEIDLLIKQAAKKKKKPGRSFIDWIRHLKKSRASKKEIDKFRKIFEGALEYAKSKKKLKARAEEYAMRTALSNLDKKYIANPSKTSSIKQTNIVIAKLDKLPIQYDPVSWSDDQLLESIGREDLFSGDKKRFEMATKEAEKRFMKKDMDYTNVDRDWYGIYSGGNLSGVISGKHNAEQIVKSLKDKYIDLGLEGFMKAVAQIKIPFMNPIDSEIYSDPTAKKNIRKEINVIENGASDFAKKIRSHVADKFFANKKLPEDFSLIDGTEVKGGFPSSQEIENSENYPDDILFDSDLRSAGSQAEEDAAKNIVEKEIRNKEMREKGIDPSKMADDDWPEMGGKDESYKLDDTLEEAKSILKEHDEINEWEEVPEETQVKLEQHEDEMKESIMKLENELDRLKDPKKIKEYEDIINQLENKLKEHEEKSKEDMSEREKRIERIKELLGKV